MTNKEKIREKTSELKTCSLLQGKNFSQEIYIFINYDPWQINPLYFGNKATQNVK